MIKRTEKWRQNETLNVFIQQIIVMSKRVDDSNDSKPTKAFN